MSKLHKLIEYYILLDEAHPMAIPGWVGVDWKGQWEKTGAHRLDQIHHAPEKLGKALANKSVARKERFAARYAKHINKKFPFYRKNSMVNTLRQHAKLPLNKTMWQKIASKLI